MFRVFSSQYHSDSQRQHAFDLETPERRPSEPSFAYRIGFVECFLKLTLSTIPNPRRKRNQKKSGRLEPTCGYTSSSSTLRVHLESNITPVVNGLIQVFSQHDAQDHLNLLPLSSNGPKSFHTDTDHRTSGAGASSSSISSRAFAAESLSPPPPAINITPSVHVASMIDMQHPKNRPNP